MTEHGRNSMPVDTKQRHVLVINDSPEILEMFRYLFSDEGFRVSLDRFAVEMGEMLSRVKALKPDLIVLDYIIGNEGMGWQFLQMLKMDRETKELPIIVCTAAVDQVQQISAHLDDIGVEVVLKPFDIDHLLEVVEQVLEVESG